MSILFHESKDNYVKGFLLLIILSFTLTGGIVNAEIATMEDIKELNPAIAGIEYPETLGGFTFTINKDTGVVEVVQVVFEDTVGWHPWFIQEKDSPDHINEDTRLYAQKLYLAEYSEIMDWFSMISYQRTFNLIHPDDVSPFDRFGDPIPLNFNELWPVMPTELEGPQAAEKMGRIKEDGSILFLCPPGPGIGFLIEEEHGDIYALLRIQQEEETDFPSPLRQEAFHPELGNFFYTGILLRDPGDMFDIDSWYDDLIIQDALMKPGDSIEEGDVIEPGFVLQKLELEDHGFLGVPMFMIEMDVLNDTGQKYQVGRFEVKIFDQEGNLIGEGIVPLMDSEDGAVSTMKVPIDLQKESVPDEVTYSIIFLN